jgi:hypothetical protein
MGLCRAIKRKHRLQRERQARYEARIRAGKLLCPVELGPNERSARGHRSRCPDSEPTASLSQLQRRRRHRYGREICATAAAQYQVPQRPSPVAKWDLTRAKNFIRMDTRFRARLTRAFERGKESRQAAANQIAVPRW